jgi:hypothetical protein
MRWSRSANRRSWPPWSGLSRWRSPRSNDQFIISDRKLGAGAFEAFKVLRPRSAREALMYKAIAELDLPSVCIMRLLLKRQPAHLAYPEERKQALLGCSITVSLPAWLCS